MVNLLEAQHVSARLPYSPVELQLPFARRLSRALPALCTFGACLGYGWHRRVTTAAILTKTKCSPLVCRFSSLVLQFSSSPKASETGSAFAIAHCARRRLGSIRRSTSHVGTHTSLSSRTLTAALLIQVETCHSLSSPHPKSHCPHPTFPSTSAYKAGP